jgi:hypothetical protein
MFLRGDELDLVLLAAELVADGLGDLGIDLGQAGGEEVRKTARGDETALMGRIPREAYFGSAWPCSYHDARRDSKAGKTG